MDVSMPVMDGREATQLIKATDHGKTTTVIALTARALEDEQAQMLACGADAFLLKPYDAEELLDVIASQLGLEYTYESDAYESAGGAQMLEQLHQESLLGLPEDFRVALLKAAQTGDVDRCLDLLGDLDAQHRELATSLADLVDRYAFEELIGVL